MATPAQLFERARRYPLGAELFSLAVTRRAPYFASISRQAAAWAGSPDSQASKASRSPGVASSSCRRTNQATASSSAEVGIGLTGGPVGGMGAVYQAWDAELGVSVALKVIRAEYASSGTALSRFEREARAAAKLRHPNIVTVYEVGEADGPPE